jgi:hypothetical protein
VLKFEKKRSVAKRLKVQNQPLDNRNLRKMNIQHCKITYRYELDIEIDTEKSSVELVI